MSVRKPLEYHKKTHSVLQGFDILSMLLVLTRPTPPRPQYPVGTFETCSEISNRRLLELKDLV